MKIKRINQSHIVIQDNTPLFLLVVGLTLIGGAITALLFLNNRAELECNRSGQNVCVINSWSAFKKTSSPVQINQIQTSVVEKGTPDNEGNVSYYVVLITDSGSINFAGYSSNAEAENYVDMLNEFLNNPNQDRVSVTWDNRSGMLMLWGIMFFMGLMIVRFYEVSKLDLDYHTGYATVGSKKILSSDKTEILLKDIARAEVEESIRSNSKAYGISIVQRNGIRTLISFGYSPDCADKQKIVVEINRFLEKYWELQRVNLR